ncbi:Xaa-Pro dipeptidyl-peptidase [Streptococcus constellatus]|uniref:Xaa-Pro dipeptidyl-peptidase n=1 Tax=Streptococcus constellatus subsp. constellatus SK53 TaxID=1095730 RepID=A0AAD2SUX6_STRCV|nr:Xaa-Pro dipeptidyl-peptidase [Streptococcus constellatus]EID18632.1 Xaa-Pro dipeptidyl-peptidase [Streptococcus constellatus subsp. constellatus SK53]MDP1485891.1 Xaa-Pro dipeptidyl-peptidase [Streptococcus constellatus]QQT05336.1 Xaa-Pro dipeptidyl-peptidase [Streptococcus constellatus]SUN39851.1 x-prolyl-dipeptidyl aminopeptidase [Streptococcus constellatus]BBD21901.1 x-prolyl-dipeptidyl aminopeptidase [Streptococcus constellatus subsp. constellatus]
MRYNQYSYTPETSEKILAEMESIGFSFRQEYSDKENLETFVRKTFFNYKNTDYALKSLVANSKTDLLSFFTSNQKLTAKIFYTIAFQLLEFVPFVDFDDVEKFRKNVNFPIIYGNLLENLYQLLNTRTKNGNLLIDKLISDGLIPEDNTYHYFNGKSLATFTSHNAIREVAYVESRVDTDKDSLPDLIKVSIIRPRFDGQIPAVMTASPYHQGTNDKASDKALYNMNVDLIKKETGKITVHDPELHLVEPQGQATLVEQTEETLGHIGTYTLNDYLLPRGFANLYVSGVGTKDSDGLMTSGDYYQIEAYKNVIDWLNGRCRAFTDHTRQREIKATWSNGKVATTGISYLGTLSNGLATTGVDGLEVIIAEAGISSWYNYYRENGLVTSPGGYPGEDFDSLTELTYSRNLLAGENLRHNAAYQSRLTELKANLDRETGDYNQFWHDRNYLIHAHKVKAEVVFTHGSQDWNVKPLNVYNMFHALPEHIKKHLFFHNGAHIYMNNWQSIDFRESMNALLSKKLLGYDSQFELPTVIWQDNRQAQSWLSLETFGDQEHYTHFNLGESTQEIKNQYTQEDYDRFSKTYQTFKNELFDGKANQVTVDMLLEKDLFLNGPVKLNLRLKSSIDKGLISAQLLDISSAKRLLPLPAVLAPKVMDNGRFYMLDHLMELPFKETPHRVITKGFLNLQNRTDLLTVEEVTPDQWMEFSFELQPTIYKMAAGDTLRLVLYTTDFEHTVRDHTDYYLTIDLSQSSLEVPTMK